MIRYGFALVIWTFLVASAAPAFANFTVFGPKTYTRTAATPSISTEQFQTCELGGQYRLVVQNGEPDGSQRLSSASILLNGIEVMGSSDLNQNVAQIERTVSIHASNALEVRLAAGPGGKLSVKLDCLAGCLSVEIDAPPNDSIVNRSTALVTGHLSSLAEQVGISVNGFSGFSFAGRFAEEVPLEAGENLLTAVATNSCGERTEATVRVNVTAMEQKAHLEALPAGGAAPLEVTLHATPLFRGAVAQYEWDINGDGAVDQSGSDLSEVSTTYATEGLYFPRLTLVDRNGNRYTETAVVQLFSGSAVQALLLKKWDGLRASMRNKDVDGAAGNFAQSTRERYRKNFTVMRDILPVMAEDLGTPRFVRFVQNGAMYEVRSVRAGKEYSFHVEFAVDVDGIWRIRWF